MNFKGGQSGARLSLIHPSGSEKAPVVRKEPGGKTSQESLFRQYELMQRLHSEVAFQLKVPTLGSLLPKGGYEIEYFQGVHLGDFLKIATQKEAEEISNLICSHFLSISSSSMRSAQLENLFEKLDALETVIGDPGLTSWQGGVISHGLAKMKGFMAGKPEFPDAVTHGDFSFENVLVNRKLKELAVIDANPSPVETYLLDIGRLQLDALLGWWKSGVSESANTNINRSILSSALSDLARESEESVRFFIVLSALRIIPYTTDPIRLAYLINAIDKESRRL